MRTFLGVVRIQADHVGTASAILAACVDGGNTGEFTERVESIGVVHDRALLADGDLLNAVQASVQDHRTEGEQRLDFGARMMAAKLAQEEGTPEKDTNEAWGVGAGTVHE